MALAVLRPVLRCCLLMATVALTVTGVSARIVPSAATPWTPPINTFAHAPIHSHTWAPPLQAGAPPLPPLQTIVLARPPSPYPLFHTLPYPLPRPLLCPGFIHPPYAVDQSGKAFYQNNGRLPLFPPPYTLRCFPQPWPLPFERAPTPS